VKQFGLGDLADRTVAESGEGGLEHPAVFAELGLRPAIAALLVEKLFGDLTDRAPFMGPVRSIDLVPGTDSTAGDMPDQIAANLDMGSQVDHKTSGRQCRLVQSAGLLAAIREQVCNCFLGNAFRLLRSTT
jgi:hypothetical protein